MCDAARGIVLLAMAGFVTEISVGFRALLLLLLIFRYIRTRATLDFFFKLASVQGSVEFPCLASL